MSSRSPRVRTFFTKLCTLIGGYGIIDLINQKDTMKYTLITSKGKVYTFFIKAVAETYLAAFGGNLFDASILETVKEEVTL